jgi:uroporphyrin-III C-methyltransferase / precorrin-2 dehydrogenase / sirohydrochlorin ferrochelatase
MSYLPVSLDLGDGFVVLAGSGAPAHAKLHLLCAAGARVKWFGAAGARVDETGDAVQGREMEQPVRAAHACIERFEGAPSDADLAGARALVCASGDALDAALAARARALGVPVNVVDRPHLSTFILPAIVRRGDVTVAIATGGASPVLARRLRERVEAALPARVGTFAALLQRYRNSIIAARKRGARFSTRRFWERVVDGPIGAAFLAGRTRAAEAALAAAAQAPEAFVKDRAGMVHLVGAGPGDPDLLTLRALAVLQDADIVFFDDLVAPEVLDRARRDAERVPVGKRRGHPGMAQDEINRRLAQAAKAGKRVVRLKGGDPFVFGRGGEELEHLQAAGVPVFVVPGITAALGCAAELGLPLTFRAEATQLAFVTAHTADGARRIDWSAFAGREGTLVVYMGLAAAEDVRAGLIAAGRSPRTAAAVVARGTRADARVAVGRLDDLCALAAEVREGPALLVIGDVVARCAPWRAAEAARRGAAAAIAAADTAQAATIDCIA